MNNVHVRLLVFVNEIFIDDAKRARALIGIIVPNIVIING